MDYYELLLARQLSGGGGGGGELSSDVKQALLECFSKVAWIDENGQDYYNTLESALFQGGLNSITATYTQSGTVYSDAELDSLKTDLVVTANWNDSTTSTVNSSSYTLSGTLTAGTSTITVTYMGKTDTFDVTVTQSYANIFKYATFVGHTGGNATYSQDAQGFWTITSTGNMDWYSYVVNTGTIPVYGTYKGHTIRVEYNVELSAGATCDVSLGTKTSNGDTTRQKYGSLVKTSGSGYRDYVLDDSFFVYGSGTLSTSDYLDIRFFLRGNVGEYFKFKYTVYDLGVIE